MTADQLVAYVDDALASVAPMEERELRALGLVTDCPDCGDRVAQRRRGPRRVTCSDRCRQRLARSRRRTLGRPSEQA